ncbi:MAG: hypothetical protein ACT4O1_08530 [Gemmatimonadota bacterium]
MQISARFPVAVMLTAVMTACETGTPPMGVQPNFDKHDAHGPPVRINQTQDWCDRNPTQCPGAVPDPNPLADGIYLGSEITYENCNEGAFSPGGDLDQDEFGDYCEELIAQFFAPQLSFSSQEQMREHEPYWAARPLGYVGYGSWIPAVRVFYALPYYKDGGAYGLLCNGCTAHFGDSEWVAFDIVYRQSTKHWEFDIARLSAHGSAPEYGWGDFEWPEKQRGYPRIHVAEGKHANYPTEQFCDSGAHLGYDFCNPPFSYERYRYSIFRHLGSRITPFKNCVQSAESAELAAAGWYECFWTAETFKGWSGINEDPAAGGYKHHLGNMGF